MNSCRRTGSLLRITVCRGVPLSSSSNNSSSSKSALLRSRGHPTTNLITTPTIRSLRALLPAATSVATPLPPDPFPGSSLHSSSPAFVMTFNCKRLLIVHLGRIMRDFIKCQQVLSNPKASKRILRRESDRIPDPKSFPA